MIRDWRGLEDALEDLDSDGGFVAAMVKAEAELIEIARQVLPADAVVGAPEPRFQV